MSVKFSIDKPSGVISYDNSSGGLSEGNYMISVSVDNAGGVPELVIKKVGRGKKGYGYDAATGKFGNMFDMQIVDPHLVVLFPSD